MYTAPTRCPVCQSELTIARLRCESCDTALEGRFTSGPFAQLSAEQLDFVITFIRCEGKINRMEPELNLSYPTIRNRLVEVIRAMGFEPGKEEAPEMDDQKRRLVLENLELGKISPDAAMKMLRGAEE